MVWNILPVNWMYFTLLLYENDVPFSLRHFVRVGVHLDIILKCVSSPHNPSPSCTPHHLCYNIIHADNSHTLMIRMLKTHIHSVSSIKDTFHWYRHRCWKIGHHSGLKRIILMRNEALDPHTKKKKKTKVDSCFRYVIQFHLSYFFLIMWLALFCISSSSFYSLMWIIIVYTENLLNSFRFVIRDADIGVVPPTDLEIMKVARKKEERMWSSERRGKEGRKEELKWEGELGSSEKGASKPSL